MGTRDIITITCPDCGQVDDGVYYAPTCNFISHECSGCGAVIDLADYTGTSHEDASNAAMLECITDAIVRLA